MLDVMRANLATAVAWPALDLTADHERWRTAMRVRAGRGA